MPRLTYGISLPILRAFAADDGTYRTTSEILGTCFSIGEGHMLTAHHVVENWNSDDSPMVVGVLGQQEFFSGACIMNTERLVGDIALIKTELPRHMRAEPEEHFITAPWAYEPLSTFARIRTIGYPYGLDHSGGKPSVVARGFEGHVVSRLKAFQRPGSSDEPVTRTSCPSQQREDSQALRCSAAKAKWTSAAWLLETPNRRLRCFVQWSGLRKVEPNLSTRGMRP